MPGTFDDFLRSQDEATRLDRASILRAAEVSPDEAAEAQRLAPLAGLPTPVVQRNLPDVRKQQSMRSFEQFLLDTPELGELSRDDGFLAVAQDQTQEMGALKQTMVNLRAATNRATGGVLTATGALLGNLEETFQLPAWLDVGFGRDKQGQWRVFSAKELRAQRERGEDLFSRIERVGSGIQESAQREQRPLAPWQEVLAAEGVLPTAVAGTAFIAEQTALSIPEMLGAYFAPWALGASYAGRIGEERRKRRGDEEISGEDLAIGSLAAVPIALLNKYGADKVLGTITALEQTVARRIITAGVAEGVTEVLQDQIEYVAERAGIDPLDVHEMLAMIPPTLLGAAGAGAALRGGSEVIAYGAQQLATRERDSRDAEMSAETLAELDKLAQAAKLRERSPEQFKKFVEALDQTTDLYIAPQDLEGALNQSEVQLPDDIVQRIEEATEAATPVRFSVAEYVTYFAGSGTLSQKVRVGRADAINAEEAANIESEFAERAEQVTAEAQNADALMAEGEQIRQQVQAQIVSTGRFRGDVADAYAALVRDFFVATAGNTGVSPAELYARYPLRIQAASITGDATLDQVELAPLNEAALQPVAALERDAGPTPRGFTRFRHYGNFEVPELDPSFQGTGLRGAERLRTGGPQVISVYPESRTTPEQGVGPVPYFVDVPTSRIYDASEDPLNLKAKARNAPDEKGFPTIGLNMSLYERLIKQAGFAGYTVSGGSTAGQARLFDKIPVVSAPKQAAADIPRDAGLPPAQREIETRFAEYLANNFEEAVARYDANPETQGGKILNTDIARELSPDYAADRSQSAAVHKPASWFIKQLYARKLREAPAGAVLFTGGGTGAGKSSGLRALGASESDFTIIYDSNITSAPSAGQRIEQALATGRPVHVLYTYGDPVESLRRAIQRTKRMAARSGTGRTVPLSAHVTSHVGSREAVPQLIKRYADNPQVSFSLVINKQGQSPQVVKSVADLPVLEYDSVLEAVRSELEKQQAEGGLTAAEYQGFLGADQAASGKRARELESRSAAEREAAALGYQEVAPVEFAAALETARAQMSPRDRGQVSPLAPDFQGRVYLTADRTSGFAIADDGELAHVFKAPGAPRGVMDRVMVLGRELGATHLWAFENLAPAYAARGATETQRFPFDDELAPAGWDTATMGRPAVVRMSLDPALEQQARGQITLGRDITATPSVITLLQNADLSTFLHESGHFFFEVLADLAARPNAPPQLVQDVQTIFAWVDFKGTPAEWRALPIEQRREAHEQFARGFEAWLLEGKAPNPDQRRLFQRFRAWLLNIYKSLQALNVNLTDEVRSVMSRMVATREQVIAAEQERAMEPLFPDAQAANMTPEEWQAYQNNWRAATENAQDQLQARSLRNVRWLNNARSKELKRMQAENAAKRAEIREEVADEVAQRPERIAETLLLDGEAFIVATDGEVTRVELEGRPKISTDALAEMYGTTADFREQLEAAGVDPQGERAFWHALPRNLTAKQGIHPDTLAEMVGLTSGDQLVRALLSMAPRERLVEQVTDSRVLQRYGDLNNAQELERAADIAVHNQMRTRMVATELAALEAATTAGRRDALRRAAREFAERVVRRKKVRELRPGQFSAAEAAAARESSKALAAGDSTLAAVRKRDQLFNGYASRAASRAQDSVEKGLRYLNTFSNAATRKALEPGYRDQIDKLLERFDLRARSLREIDKRTALANWIKEQQDQGNEPAIPDELMDEAQRTHYRNLTVEQFEGLVDAVKNIEHLARLKNRLLKNARQRDFDKAKAELITSIEKHAPAAKPEKLEQDASAFARAGQLVTEWLTSLRKLSSVVRVMDGGGDGGLAWEYFVRPLNEAADSELRMRAEATQKLNELLNMVPGLNPNVAQRVSRRISGQKKVFIPSIQKSLSLEARLAVALNAGNEGNKKRLLEGNSWTEPQLQAVIDTLSKQEMEFVQAVFDFIGSYWSEIKAKELRVTGVSPEQVEASPIKTKHGEYRGGYYPIVADPMRSDKAAQQNDAELIAQSLRGAVARATTRRGHTKERVGGKDPVRLDLAVIAQHVSQVTHDLAWHETLIDYNKLLRDRDVSGLIRERYGADMTAMMRRVADDVARGEVAARTASERVLNYLRVGSTISGLGLSATTTLLQLSGLAQSFVRVGYRAVGAGMAAYAAHPVDVTKQVYAKSVFMRDRSIARNRELGEIFNRLDGKQHTAASIYFWPIQAFQTVVDVPTWLGAYNKALQNGEEDARAVSLADQAVRDAQSSGQLHDLAEIQRGGPLLKLFTNFYSYFSATYQLAAESATRFNRQRSVSAALRMATDYLMLVSVPIAFSMLLKEGLRGDEPEDDLPARLAKAHVSYALGMFPLVREVSGALEGFDYRGPAGLSFFGDASQLVKQTQQGEVDEAFLRSLNRAAGILLHYPAGQVDRTVRGMVAVAEGDAGPQAILVGPPVER